MAERSASVDRHEPAVLASLLHETVAVANYASITNAAVAVCIGFFFWNTGPRAYLVGLAAALGVSNAATLVLAVRFRRPLDGMRPAIVKRGLAMAKALAFAIGLTWSTMPYMLFRGADAGHQLIIFGTVAGLVSDAFCVGPVLAVSMLLVLPIVAGATLALCIIKPPLFGSTALLLTIYAAFVFASQLRLAKQSRQRIRDRLLLNEQGQTITLLLNDFEEGASDWLWETDRNGILRHAPARMAAALSCRVEDIQGVALDRLLRGRVRPDADRGALDAAIAAMARHEAFHDLTVAIRTREGDRWWTLNGKPSFDDHGEFGGYRGVGSDVTRDREAERRVAYFANHDVLTGLPNRAAFQNASNLACAAPIAPVALLYLDLDGFKAVNDGSGHGTGDRLLASVAERLRTLAPPPAQIFRLGGDEFAILLACRSRAAIGMLATRLVEGLRTPFRLDELLVEIGLSVGIAYAPDDASRSEELLAKADLALYSAKQSGKGCWRDFDVALEEKLLRRRRLDLEMREALHAGELALHYQPLIGMPEERVIGFEALLRWHRGDEGWISPAEVVSIAEATGFIVDIGRWALRKACTDALAWPGMLVAVNVSPAHFKLSGFVRDVEDVLAATGIEPARLEIEITESILIDRKSDILNKFAQLRSIGVRLSLDDFGTGYSSLSYLTCFTFDKIKIDQSFTRDLHSRPECRAVVEAITILAEALSIDVTAEGIETLQQLDLLRTKCCSVQGFLYSPARPAEELAPMLLLKDRWPRQRTLDHARDRDEAPPTTRAA